MIIRSIGKLNIPDKPGVYFFKSGKDILYIGKATSLKSRVKSYFGHDLLATRGPLLVDMLANADNVDWQETDSVLEALILEAALIKRHLPKYNTDGKSDKSWNYVCITKSALPAIILRRERQLEFDKSDLKCCYGPFTNGGQLREALKIIRRIFPYIDASASKKANYMFYKQVGLAPDITTEEGKKAYLLNIKNIKLLFEGKKKRILKDLEKKMKTAAKAMEFEQANEWKRQLFSLKHINDIALLKNDIRPGTSSRIEAYDIAHMSGKSMVGVMVVVENGQAAKSEYRKFKIRTKENADDTGSLKEVLERRLGHAEWPLPNLIVIDGGIAQYNAAEAILKEKGFDIEIVSVVKDERHKPREFIGEAGTIENRKREILLANSEAHRFGIAYHKNLRGRNFLK